jgi:Ser/Thr protein kinase RdoA (MazF antagonist)
MFPVTDSNLRTDALVDQVLPPYGLGPISRCRLHTRGLNDTYKIETGRNETYFLRVYRHRWRSREQIETEIAILSHLARYGVSVSVPLARVDGQSLTPVECAEGRRWGVLFTSARGKELDQKAYTEALAEGYGAAAAAIHGAADGFDGHRRRPPLDLDELLERPLGLVLSMIAHRADDVSYVMELGDRLRRRIQDTPGLEVGFCHGDLHGQNAGEDSGSFTFYDFDCCGWGYRAYDMAVFPWAFAVNEAAPERIETMGRAFLVGYMRQRRLSDIDVASIPAFVAVREIWLMGLHIGLGDRFGWGWINDRYFDRRLKFLRAWQKSFLDRPAAAWLVAAGGLT